LASLRHEAAEKAKLAQPCSDADLEWLMKELVVLADMWQVPLPKGPALKKFMETMEPYPRHLLVKAIAAVCDEVEQPSFLEGRFPAPATFTKHIHQEFEALKSECSDLTMEQQKEEFRRQLEARSEAMRQARWARERAKDNTRVEPEGERR
jgi:hypothetical protein